MDFDLEMSVSMCVLDVCEYVSVNQNMGIECEETTDFMFAWRDHSSYSIEKKHICY